MSTVGGVTPAAKLGEQGRRCFDEFRIDRASGHASIAWPTPPK
jgi:hypothetical protein